MEPIQIVMATRNAGKVKEIQSILPAYITLLSLDDIGFTQEIEEPFDTLAENAFVKANAIYQKYKIPVFADDSGLFVTVLNDEPGVKSARYAGKSATSKENIDKLLANLLVHKNRNAAFKTTICLIINKETHYFNGEANGTIIDASVGTNGFGYDSVFVPNGEKHSFAEMDLETKNKFSHRKKAFFDMINWINKKK